MKTAAVALVWMLGACSGGGDDNNFGTDGSIPPPNGATGPYFETPMFFNDEVAGVQPAATSGQQIAALRAGGGWGNSDTMQIDFSIDVLSAPSGTPMRAFTPTADFYDPDCDQVEMP
ncbi:MAG: hypothetical protein ABI175_22635, partial [Polyangiales bacterium]